MNIRTKITCDFGSAWFVFEEIEDVTDWVCGESEDHNITVEGDTLQEAMDNAKEALEIFLNND